MDGEGKCSSGKREGKGQGQGSLSSVQHGINLLVLFAPLPIPHPRKGQYEAALPTDSSAGNKTCTSLGGGRAGLQSQLVGQ